MKVILKEDVKNIGSMGQIVDLADGFVRNYLVPRGLAVEAM
jgi:large subunit ribosomal protein L9